MAFMDKYIYKTPQPPKKTEVIQNKNLSSIWHNWTMQLKKISVKTSDMLFGDSKLQSGLVRSNKAQMHYHVVIVDEKAKHIPVLQVFEWQKDGHLQTWTPRVEDTRALLHDVTFEQVGAHINTGGNDCYLLVGRINEVVDGVSGNCNIEILQWGPQAHIMIPYFLFSFAMLLEFTSIYFNCSSIHEAMLKYPEFIELGFTKELLYELLIKSLKQNPNSPFTTYIGASKGDIHELIDGFLEFYFTKFVHFNIKNPTVVIDPLNAIIFN